MLVREAVATLAGPTPIVIVYDEDLTQLTHTGQLPEKVLNLKVASFEPLSRFGIPLISVEENDGTDEVISQELFLIDISKEREYNPTEEAVEEMAKLGPG